MSASQPHTDFNRCGGAKRVVRNRPVVGTHCTQHLCCVGAHDRDDAFTGGDIDNNDIGVATLAMKPCHIANHRCCRRYHQEDSFGQACNSDIRLYATALVEHLRIDNFAHIYRQIITAHTVQKRFGVGALDAYFPKRGHIIHTDVGSNSHVLGFGVFKPVLPLPAIVILGILSGIRKPVGAFPASGLAKHSALLFQMFMQRCATYASGRCHLSIRIVVCV